MIGPKDTLRFTMNSAHSSPPHFATTISQLFFREWRISTMTPLDWSILIGGLALVMLMIAVFA
jgi:hypothetical protein